MRVEQYAQSEAKLLSKYNSINQGEEITYTLELTNMSIYSYCSDGNYSNEDDCKEAEATWITTDINKKKYSDLTIVGHLPEGTTYVKCSNNCIISNNIVKWADVSVDAKKNTYSYTIKVDKNQNVTNFGMEIKYNNNTLTMDSITTKVNKTLTLASDKEKISKTVETFGNLVSNQKIMLSFNVDNYKNDLSGISNIKMSSLDFVKSIYYNSINLDLGFFTGDDIKQAIFNKSSDGLIYSKKTDKEIKALINDTHISINKMLVVGMYGGRILKGNDNKDRATYLSTSYLEYGDVIVTFGEQGKELENVYLYMGNTENNEPIIAEFTDKNGSPAVVMYNSSENDNSNGYRKFKEIYAKNLFAVLRPTQLVDSKSFEDSNNYDKENEKENNESNNKNESNKPIENPNTGYTIAISSLVVILIIGTTITILNKNKKKIYKLK